MRMLFVTQDYPFPLVSGDAILTWHTIVHLAKAHTVDLVCCSPSEGEDPLLEARLRSKTTAPRRAPRGKRLRQVLSLATRRGAIETMSRDRRFGDALSVLLRSSQYDLVFIDHLRMGWTVEALDGVARRPPVLFRSHNCESDVRQRYAAHATNPVSRALFRVEAAKTEHYENRVVTVADAVVAITPEDAELHRRQGAKRVFVVPPGFDFPDGLSDTPRTPGTLVLMGSFGYLAKELNALFLLKEVLPLVRRRLPSTRLLLVGSGPSRRLRAAAAAAGGVTVTGRVEDPRAIARQGEVFVMPTVVGGGFELKALEAIGMGLPIVATPLAAHGLGLEDERSILIGQGAHAFAGQAVRALMDESLRRRIARQAFAEVQPRFSWAAVNGRLDDAIAAG